MSHGMVEDAIQVFRPYQGRSLNHTWSYSVMVITLDFESSDPGSNPGRTFLFGGNLVTMTLLCMGPKLFFARPAVKTFFHTYK